MNKKYSLQGCSLLFFTFYLSGTLIPDLWWSTHFLAFLPPFMKYGFLVLACALMLYTFWKPEGIPVPKRSEAFFNQNAHWIILGISFFMAFLMYSFPISQDFYGDAYKLLPHIDQRITEIPTGTHEAFFNIGISPWNGHTTILALITYIAYYFGISYGDAFLVLDTICGGLFVFSWLRFLHNYFHKFSWKILLGLAGVSAPFILIYFGHNESYAPVFLCFLLWVILSLTYLRMQETRHLWSLFFLLLLCIKLHPVALLFVPAIFILFIQHYFEGKIWALKLSTWRGVSQWLLLPIYLAGAILYFFVFEDYKDPRHLNFNVMEFDRLFLPILSPPPPLDAYNLLSLNHVFDYFSEVLLWSPIALLAILLIVIHGSKEIAWNSPPILLTGVSLLLFSSLFFVINPLLSMQMDWDLMAIPAPIFLIFTVVLAKELEDGSLAEKLLPSALGLALLSLPIILVHSQPQLLSQRLESLGIRMYHSYYEWSSRTFEYALSLSSPTREEYTQRKQAILAQLEPHTIPDEDFEYARLLIEEGKYFLREEKNYQRALEELNKATYYFPNENNLLLYKMEAHFLLKQYLEAFAYSEQLVAIQYPSEEKSITISLQCALEAGLYDQAQSLAAFHVKKWNSREVIKEVLRRLEEKEDIETIKRLFSQPDEHQQ